jgi:hypothetical protein
VQSMEELRHVVSGDQYGVPPRATGGIPLR